MVLTATQVLQRVHGSAQEVSTPAGQKLAFQALGSPCQIIFNVPSSAAGDYYKQDALRWVAEFEAKYSRFISSSLIGRLNQSAGRGWVEIDEETEQLLGMCQQLWSLTRGAFDPTALPLIELWNWRADPPVIPDDASIRAARELVGWNQLERKPHALRLPRPGMRLDLGGIGKEYAVDRVLQLAQEHGLQSALVDFGQDVRVFGTPPGKPAWHIGLEDPQKPGTCWTGVAAKDMAVATSGDYLRKFEIGGKRYGHILDPRTGRPVDNGCRAVTVLAPSCTIAGLLATTAFLVGPTEGVQLVEGYPGAEGCLITDTQRHETRRFHEYLTH